MPLILNIDTAINAGSVNLSDNGKIIGFLINANEKELSGWLHPAINKIIRDAGYSMPDLEAVAVSNGPGSYTGLRISLSTAKGICYALGIPLITVGTLEIMAMAAQKKLSSGNPEKKLLLCPMIDARRMEVYFSLYDQHLTERQKPATIILDQTSFAELLKENYIAFFGNGSQKCSQLLSNPHALFPEIPAHTANDLSMISFQYFIHQQFADISYVEPLYVKEFFTTAEKKS